MSEEQDRQEFIKSIRPQLEQLRLLQVSAETEWKATISEMERVGNQDINVIEQMLDHLLGWAESGESLELYKQICRYLWTFDPESASSYIYSWRDCWDEEYLNSINTKS